jgi:uncharacterized membrane protein
MFELFIFIVILAVFLYSKDRADRLRDEISNLRARMGIKGEVPAQTEMPAQTAPFEEQAPRPEMAAIEVIETAEAIEPAQEIPRMPVLGETPRVLEPEPVIKTEIEKRPDENLEFKIGSKVFTGVGVVAVICAIGFFLRYAFEVNLINQFTRVALGVVAGLILLAIGEFTRKKYPNYGQALTGGGLGVLYVSFYAAFNFYQLMAQPAAFFAMIMVTAVGISLSLRQNSMALAMFAQIGGFLTPLLINSGSGSPHILFLYVILLDIAVFLTAFYKSWQPLSAVSFIGTVLAYLYWYFNFYNSLQFTPALGYLSLFFVIFLCIPFIQYFIRKTAENSWDLQLLMGNPVFYFAMSYALINPLYHDLMGWFTIVLGSLYCTLAVVVGGKDERASLFRHFLLTPGFVLLAIAVPIQFEGKWIVAAWAAEALAFIATGFRIKSGIYRALGNLVILLSLFRLLVFESNLPEHAILLLNGRFLSYIMCFAAAAGAAYLYRQRKKEVGESESSVFSLLLLESAFAIIAASAFEVHDFFSDSGKWTVMVWAVEALAFIFAGFRMKLPIYRGVGHCLIVVSLIWLLFEGHLKIGAMPIFNIRLLAYAVFFAVAVAAAYIYRRRKGELGESERALFSFLALEGAFAGLLGLSLEIHDFYEGYWYPILWTAGGLAAGLLSFRLKSATLRCVTYLTFIAAFFHLLGFDTYLAASKYVPLFNTRLFTFMVSAVFIRFFLSLLRANKEKVSGEEFQLFQPGLFMMFHFLMLWVASAEIISYCDKQMLGSSKVAAAYDFENIKNVMLSAAWTVYGVVLMAVGILKKTTYERFLAITLFGIVIVKVFLVDTAQLGNLYRFFSFIILGCFLLLVGYLYYRYQDRIRKFVKGE